MSDAAHLKITWVDYGRDPQCAANPEFPAGVDIDMVWGRWAEPNCLVSLPYPAKRCGRYEIACTRCGLTMAVSTAGRADDPRSVRVLCKKLPS